MNVLVYSGPEVLQTSLNYTLITLRSILLPHYSVQPITLQTLSAQPWSAACALLVFPRCRDPFISPASKLIQNYVEGGGSFLALGTGAQCTPRRLAQDTLSFSSSSFQQPPLRFYDATSNSYIYPSLTSTRDNIIPKVAELKDSDGAVVQGFYEIGTNEFEGFEGSQGASVLARYAESGRKNAISGVIFNVGNGGIALWGPSLEYPLVEEPASELLASLLSTDKINAADKIRSKLLRNSLLQLGIQLPSEPENPIARPLPQFLISTPSNPTIVSQIIDAIATPLPGSQLSVFEDTNDTFHFHQLAESTALLEETRKAVCIPSDPSTWQPKQIITCPNGELPSRKDTPIFDLELYFKTLEAARKREGCSYADDSWGLGEALLYGEAVTSTQTMLDKNPRLLSSLPIPLLSLASYQLAGRGRGSNIWLSPAGCLQFSILYRVSLTKLPASKLVFIQYLFALAVVEAFHEDTIMGKKGDRIHLKWPNDVYALVGAGEEKKKIGGILVSTNFLAGNVDIVIGCGLNILNPPPITSASQLLSVEERSTLSIERTAATIMAKFESMWITFLKEYGSFDSFMNLYLKHWLHSDQLVTLTTTTPHTQVRITGITSDHGLLRTVPERTGWSPLENERYIDLQPDGNSFDLMTGMIKTKT
ncbi:biotin-protein ligase [Crucibulum laeve]|uniref:Biotin-protein ligase n=1 Tax=Crucibulum laeve TaxID=68775 RepID=A0A5C3LGV5_9AGAR|nr:biotin-protein ligase [Crucibulum laeve]